MGYINQISDFLSKLLGVETEYIKLKIISFEIILVIYIIKLITKKIYSKSSVSSKKKFIYNRSIQMVLNVITFILILLVWSEKLQSIITLISFISAGLTIAIREIIFNFFAGIYIKFSKPFELEDRIEIDGIRGDVIKINALGFEVLDVQEKEKGEQSTGKITHIPNSKVFQEPLKNYVKAFKYIWDEIMIDIDINSDLEKTKEIIYNILREDEILKTIPGKMEDAIDDVTVEYRIYYNELMPIIYTKIVKDHIELSIRFLVHPKKARNVENNIYEKILEEYKNGNIELIVKEGNKV